MPINIFELQNREEAMQAIIVRENVKIRKFLEKFQAILPLQLPCYFAHNYPFSTTQPRKLGWDDAIAIINKISSMASKAGIKQPSESDSLYHDVFRTTFVNEILKSLKQIAKFSEAIFLDPFPLSLALWEILIQNLPIIDMPLLLEEELRKRLLIERTQPILSSTARPKKAHSINFHFEQRSELINQHCTSGETPDAQPLVEHAALDFNDQQNNVFCI